MVGGFVVSREFVDVVLCVLRIAIVGAKIGAATFVGSSLAGLAVWRGCALIVADAAVTATPAHRRVFTREILSEILLVLGNCPVLHARSALDRISPNRQLPTSQH